MTIDSRAIEGPEDLDLDVRKAGLIKMRAKCGEHFLYSPGPRNADVDERFGLMRQAESAGAGPRVSGTQPADIEAWPKEVAQVDFSFVQIVDGWDGGALDTGKDALPRVS